MRDVNNEWDKRYLCHKAREHPGPCVYPPIRNRLLQDKEPSSLDDITRLLWVEVNARRQSYRIKLHLVVADVDVTVDELDDLLAKRVVDRECHMCSIGQSVPDLC